MLVKKKRLTTCECPLDSSLASPTSTERCLCLGGESGGIEATIGRPGDAEDQGPATGNGDA